MHWAETGWPNRAEGLGCSPMGHGPLVEREAGRGALGLARDTAQARVRCGQREDEGATAVRF